MILCFWYHPLPLLPPRPAPQDPAHRSLIPLVEGALAIMRLSCEKYFVLMAIYVSYLLFRGTPLPARLIIKLVARVCGVFQKVGPGCSVIGAMGPFTSAVT